MKDRLVTLLGAVAALVVVIALLSPPPAPTAGQASVPTTENKGRYGLLSLKRWLDKSGVANMSLQSRYNVLFSGEDLPSSGNLLITSAPATVPARAQELDYLLFWLSQGNDILLLSGQSDAPQWALAARNSDTGALLKHLGFQLLVEKTAPSTSAPDQDKEDEKDQNDQRSLAAKLRALGEQIDDLEYQPAVLTPLATHPLSRGVHEISARILPAVTAPTRLLGMDWPRSALVLLRDANGQAAMWEARIGRGRLWVSRFADLFGNVTLGEKDNAAFIANIIQSSLQPGGRVIFDDVHFGVSNLYDPKTFFGDSRLHNTLWFILGFWLLYVVGHTNRMIPTRNTIPKLQSVDFTYAVGGYFARRVTDQSAAMALFAHFFNDVRAYYKKPLTGEPLWELLERNPRVAPKTVTRLQELYRRLAHNKRCNLIKLRNQLLTVRKQIIL